jgi:hypothetical protein
MKFSMTGPFNTGGCLIEVTAWTGGMTVYHQRFRKI